jgi:hypothetical protein
MGLAIAALIRHSLLAFPSDEQDGLDGLDGLDGQDGRDGRDGRDLYL